MSSGGGIGDKICAEASCDRFGKTLAFTTVVFRKGGDELVARGSHTKLVWWFWKVWRDLADFGVGMWRWRGRMRGMLLGSWGILDLDGLYHSLILIISIKFILMDPFSRRIDRGLAP